MVKKDNPKNITFNLGSDLIGGIIHNPKKRRGRKKKKAVEEPNLTEVIVKEQLPHQKFSRRNNKALDQLLEANREKEKMELEKSLRAIATARGGALEGEEDKPDDDWFADILKPREKELKDLPQFGTTTLKIPPFFAVPTKKGWRLANPLTEIRNLAQRQHTLSVKVKRSNVKTPEIDMSIPRKIPDIEDFSKKDQAKLRGYLEAVKQGKEGQYTFKNRPRGFPAVLYKNAKRAGLRETKEPVYTRNKLKPKKAPSGVPQGRPKEDNFRARVLMDDRTEEEGEEEAERQHREHRAKLTEEQKERAKEQQEAREARKGEKDLSTDDIKDKVKWEKFIELVYYNNVYSRSSRHDIEKMVKTLKEERKGKSRAVMADIDKLIEEAKVMKPANFPPEWKTKWEKYDKDSKIQKKYVDKVWDYATPLHEETDKKKLYEVITASKKELEEMKELSSQDEDLKRMLSSMVEKLTKDRESAKKRYKSISGKGFREKKIKIDGGSLLGDLGKKAYDTFVKPKVENVKKNIHRITHPKETLQEAKDFTRHLIHGRHDAYPPSAKKILDENKDAIVQSISLHRNPLPSVYTKIMSWATKGETDKRIKEQPKDTLYHIGMWVKLSNGKTIKVEKNEVINLDDKPKKPKEEEVQAVPAPPHNLTFGDMLEKTREAVGDKKFFSYSAKDNNCGNFIEYILKTNGMNTDATHDFIGQDAKAILKGFPSLRKFMNTLTDTAGRANVLLEGGDIDAQSQAQLHGKGFGTAIARRIYDWWKPPMSFEEWREREQSRFRSDAEAEHALEQAKADRRIATAEKALAKLKADTEAHKRKLQEIREAKFRLAGEIGVWLGDRENYIDWDEAREHMERGGMSEEDKRSKERETNEKIEKEDADWDSGKGLKPEPIDWEDLKWGSFTKQFEEYKRQHPNSKIDDLEHFAESILANQQDYKKTTIKRARFYLNVLLKKKSHHSNIDMPTQGGRMIGLSRPAVLPAHIGHPALMSDQYPRIPQAFTQIHMTHPRPIGHGLYAGGGLGGDLLDDIYGGSRRMLGVGMRECEGGKIDIGRAFKKAFDPKQNGVAKAFKPVENFATKTFTPQLGRDITSGLIHKALPAVISGVAGSATSALTGNPVLGFAVGQTAGKYAGKEAGDALGKATGYGLGSGMKRPHLVKGSKEAKEYMASIRKKRGSKGGKIPAPPSRSPITDPSLL